MEEGAALGQPASRRDPDEQGALGAAVFRSKPTEACLFGGRHVGRGVDQQIALSCELGCSQRCFGSSVGAFDRDEMVAKRSHALGEPGEVVAEKKRFRKSSPCSER